MRFVRLVMAFVAVGAGPHTSLAQVRSAANDEVITIDVVPSAAKAVARWEDALVAGLTDAEAWSSIGRGLYEAGRYRECIAALERSMLQRHVRSSDDARLIAQAFGKLGNLKQSARWSALGREVSGPKSPRRKAAE
ncbi:MAG: hypothetical protein M3Z05_16070 [Gemmatimonadota bacterium]|nr:hypothetical protein [Gemmatimonadota bacterium]